MGENNDKMALLCQTSCVLRTFTTRSMGIDCYLTAVLLFYHRDLHNKVSEQALFCMLKVF